MTMKIGETIKTLRKRKALSQEDLAGILGVSCQAVSKWETGSTTPDISLVPAIAAFFDVSTDELFQYNVLENERKVWAICKKAAPIRGSQPAEAERLLREGLKQFPGNEELLTVLLYTLLSVDDREEDTIEVCNKLIEHAKNEGVRCDALRILAMMYDTVGKKDLVESTLERIPEFLFTKTQCQAQLLTGQKSLDAAILQMNISGSCMVEMLGIMARRFEETNNQEDAQRCKRIAEGIVDVFRREGGQKLQCPGYEWL